MARLAGKAAFITGAGGAIGGAIARRFAGEGASVACVDIDAGAAERTASAIGVAGGRAKTLACDVASSSEVQAAMEAAVEAFSRIDVLVNTAAINEPSGTAVELDEAAWERAIAVNVTGVFPGLQTWDTAARSSRRRQHRHYRLAARTGGRAAPSGVCDQQGRAHSACAVACA